MMKLLSAFTFVLVTACQSSTAETTPKTQPNAFDQAVITALPNYVAMQVALAADKTDGVVEAGKKFSTAIASVDAAEASTAGFKIAEVTQGVEGLTAAKDIDEMRAAFKVISKAISPWAGRVRPKGYELVWCSMAPGGWVQAAGPIRNPYYGAKMLACGEKVPAS